MKRLAIPLLALALTACGGAGTPLDLCKSAALRRAGYVSVITAADAWAVSGRPVPASVLLARQGAEVALGLLDARCLVVQP